MLGIQINGEFLDLPPGTTLEMEKENPFLQFNTDNLIGEYSLPFQVISNAKNNRLLGYAGIGQKWVDNGGVEALLYDNSIQIAAGKVKIEKSSIHFNRLSKGTISCYFLTKASGFWQDIKDMKLRDIDVGGDRSFAWAGLSTITDGFWKHIHQVAAGAVNDFDYAFYPVINTNWEVSGIYPPIMNLMYYDAMQTFPVRFPNVYAGIDPDIRERNRIVPFPYLHYVLTQAFAFAGWTVDGSILQDPDFLKITMINFRAIDWCQVTITGGVAAEVPHNPVVFNLQDHLPDMTIAKFLIALANRMGWWYDFDNISKKVTVNLLDDLVATQASDYTSRSSPVIEKTIIQDPPIYAMRNRFATNLGDGAPDFKVVTLVGDVDKLTDLPAAVEALYGNVYRVVEENNYYICQQDDSDAWVWRLYAYNIYDYEPPGFNDEIVTDATVVGVERYSEYIDLAPRIDNQGEWFGRTDESSEWGIHLCFYFGQRDNKNGDPIPFASPHIYDSNGYTLAAWSLCFRGKRTSPDSDEVGLYDVFWKRFLEAIGGGEEVAHTLYLPLHLYLQLRFSDRIMIEGVDLFIKQIKSSIPYKGQVSCISVRI